MTLHLTRDEAERLETDGWVVLFREGEFAQIMEPDGALLSGTIPPLWMVEAAKPCETCDRTGIVDAWVNGPGDVTVRRCPDCLDGKRRIAAVVPCDHTKMYHCSAWGCDGLVMVGHVVVEWGPLEALHVDDDRIDQEDWCLAIKDDHAQLFGPNRSELVTLPPDIDTATLVGQYALGVRKVEP